MNQIATFQFAAVLTGDLIKSRKRTNDAVDQAMSVLAAATKDLAHDFNIDPQKVIFERFRGDGWQVFLPQGEIALRASLRLIAQLTAQGDGMATRIGIGLGKASLPADRRLGAASGEAFTVAGDVLENQDRNARISSPSMGNPAMTAMIMLLDWQSQNWTPAQAAALFEAMRDDTPTQEEIAGRFGVSRQAIQMRLAGTGLHAIREAFWAFESGIRQDWHDIENNTPSKAPS